MLAPMSERPFQNIDFTDSFFFEQTSVPGIVTAAGLVYTIFKPEEATNSLSLTNSCGDSVSNYGVYI